MQLTELIAWFLVVTALAFILLMLVATRFAGAVTCLRHPDMKSVERNADGHRWRWRNVDGRKCWYWSKQILPGHELVWSYSEEEFNSDVDRVLERKLYRLDELD